MSSLNWNGPQLVVGNQELVLPKQEEASPSSPTRTMEDLPPELLTKILEFVAQDVDEQNSLLGYRLVNFQWKDILESLIEKKIVSGDFPTSPVMKIIEGAEDELLVRLPPSRFAAGGNPFPFNSLHFNEKIRVAVSNNAPTRSNQLILSLPAFASRFGGTLTSLSLSDQFHFPINTLATMLSSMPRLKRISLQNIMEGKDFPTPPPLPCLTFLELVLTVHTPAMSMNKTVNNIYVWLFASYADQLVRLHLESTVPFPPLQACHQYTYSNFYGEKGAIATTSESAFKNLKELKISNPSQMFLHLSETPALQHFTVVDSHFGENNFELEDIVIFIDRCHSTLETLLLNYPWDWDHRQQFPPESQNVIPRLKTLAVGYPTDDEREMVLSEFLVKFPDLKVLQLFDFRPHRFDSVFRIGDVDPHQNVNNEAVEVGNDNIQLADEVVALKERLHPTFQDLSRIWNNIWMAQRALLGHVFQHGVEEQVAVAQGRQQEGLERAMTATQMERADIFRRLAALGVNTEKVIVEQMLERGSYWNTCPRLRIVSVSNGMKPVGDVCVIRRTDDA